VAPTDHRGNIVHRDHALIIFWISRAAASCLLWQKSANHKFPSQYQSCHPSVPGDERQRSSEKWCGNDNQAQISVPTIPNSAKLIPKSVEVKENGT
jgi:hypothetical protein